jgi:5-methylcytosine-specific restriction endonuclease McrA
MPIRPENKGRYPKNWKEIRAKILDRAGHCCEGSPAYPDCRAVNYEPHPVTGSKVILTIAHLNPPVEDCSEENLRAWCQRCHLLYDIKIHTNNRRRNIMEDAERAGQITLLTPAKE